MSTEAQIRGAKSPGEALLILARAIDGLADRAVRAVVDPRAIPAIDSMVAESVATYDAIEAEQEWDKAAGIARYNEALRDLGDRPGDAEDAQAWDAQRELLKDLLNAPTRNIGVTRSAVTTTATGRDEFEVTLPPTPAVIAMARVGLVAELGIDQERWWTKPELALDLEAGIDAYVKGGPLWLHTYDRDFVMQLPESTRQKLVSDVDTTSPGDAHDLARDILKDTTVHGNKDISLDAQAKALGLAG